MHPTSDCARESPPKLGTFKKKGKGISQKKKKKKKKKKIRRGGEHFRPRIPREREEK